MFFSFIVQVMLLTQQTFSHKIFFVRCAWCAWCAYPTKEHNYLTTDDAKHSFCGPLIELDHLIYFGSTSCGLNCLLHDLPTQLSQLTFGVSTDILL